ncbi:MAG: ankyrin repeat domain-containing protein [Chlamydiales bacterium]|nr:ankyrin repeat domain-containing protein [Chlamydiales bacterium]
MTGFIKQETLIEPGLSLTPIKTKTEAELLADKASDAAQRALDATPVAKNTQGSVFTFDPPEAIAGVTELHTACDKGDIERVRMLLSTDFGRSMVNALDAQGLSPLHYVVYGINRKSTCDQRRASLKLVSLLLQRGALVDQRDGFKKTPLMHACEMGWVEAVELFTSFGADTNLSTGTGETPLILCVENGEDEIIPILIKHGVKVNEVDPILGRTALSVACKCNYTSIVRVLLASGADPSLGISEKEHQPFPPLLLACMNGNLKMVKLLVEAGADVNEGFTRAKEAHTAFSAACGVEKNDEVIQYLIKSGARPELGSATGELNKVIAKHPQYQKYLKSEKDAQALYAKRVALSNSIGNRAGASIAYEAWFSQIFFHDFAETLRTAEIDARISLKEVSRAFSRASHRTLNPVTTTAHIQRGELVIIPAGWHGHAISLVFYKGYLAVINRGEGSEDHSTAEFYKIDNRLMNQKLLANIVKMKETGSVKKGVKLYYQDLPKALSPSSDGEIVRDKLCLELSKEVALPSQEVGNCPQASAEGTIPAALALLGTVGNYRKSLEPETLAAVMKTTHEITLKKRLDYLEAYLAAHTEESTVDTYLVKTAWAKIMSDLKRNPVSLASYPLIKERLFDPETRTFRQKASASIRSGLSRLRNGLEGALVSVVEQMVPAY